MAARLRLRDLAAAGTRAVSKYTGTLFAVFVVQSLAALACMVAMALVLAQTFAHLPRFDDAVDGDLVALIECARFASQSFLALGAIGIGAVLAWQLVSWFLVGGFAGVLATRPDGRADTARCFGASGAATYLAYARLALCALPGYGVVCFVFLLELRSALPHLRYALTLGDLVWPLTLAIVPAGLLLHFCFTVTDYARVELALRMDSHDLGVIRTYLRTCRFVLRRPLALVHGALGGLLFTLVTVAYLVLSAGHPMYGAMGALMLFAIRQGVALVRLVIQVGILGGQVELGRARPLPAKPASPALPAVSRRAPLGS